MVNKTVLTLDDANRPLSVRRPHYDHTSYSYNDVTGRVSVSHPFAGGETIHFDPLFGRYRTDRDDGSYEARSFQASSSPGVNRSIVEFLAPDGSEAVLQAVATFNVLGQQLSFTGADGRSRSVRTYDELGWLTSDTSLGVTSEFVRNGFGEVTRIDQTGLNGTTVVAQEIVRAVDGFPTAVVGADGVTRGDSLRDAQGRVSDILYANGRALSVDYTAGTEVVEAAYGDREYRYEHDAWGNVTRIYSDEDDATYREFTHSVYGLETARAYDAFGSVDLTFTIGQAGRLLQEQSSLFPDPVGYDYAPMGAVGRLDRGAHQVVRTLDSDGYLSHLEADGTEIGFWERPGIGAAPQAQLGNGVERILLFDGATHVGYAEDSISRLLAVGLTDEGNVAAIADLYGGNPHTSYFGTDEFGRVTQEAHGLFEDDLELTPGDVWQDAQRFHARGFDDSTNWSSIERHDFSHDTVLSYADVPSHFYGAYGVDDSGRTEWYTRPDGVAVRVEYGPFDEISVVCDDANGSEDCFNVRVDALGRVAQILDENGNEVRAYQYAEGRVLIERTPAGETLLVMAGGEIPQAIVPDGEDPLWVHPGWNDRVAALSNADGEIVARYETSAFGEVTALDPDGYPWADPYDFCFVLGARPSLPVVGLQRFGARWYMPEFGRFATPDPLGFYDGPNVYAYVGGRPLLFSDPTGFGRQGVWTRGAAGLLYGIGTGGALPFFGALVPNPTGYEDDFAFTFWRGAGEAGHPGGGHHGPDPYWRVLDGTTSSDIIPAAPWPR